MITNNIEDFIKYLEKKKPILSIDYGLKRIGLAISDPEWLVAFPMKVIKSKKEIYDIIKSEDITGVIIGMPLDLQGKITALCNEIMELSRFIESKIGKNISIMLKDERFTSKFADNILKGHGYNVSHRRDKEDMVSACIILQEVLDKIIKK